MLFRTAYSGTILVMKILFAQGNPGLHYEHTRHNIGYKAVGEFAAKHSGSFVNKSKFFADVAEISIEGEKVILVKPTTFYNETGRSLRAIMDFYKVGNDDVLVVHDELALPFGKIRIRHSGSDAGNNGIKSLNSVIGENYARLRVGIYNELRDLAHDSNFVLSKLNKNETVNFEKYVLPKIFDILNEFIHTGDIADESFTLID